MTVKELSELFNVSDRTIRRVIQELYPDKLQKGKKTNLNKEEAVKIGEFVRKTGYIQPGQNADQDGQNAEVPTQNLELQNLQNMFIEFMKQQAEMNNLLLSFITSKKQIEIKQDYYSLLGYMRYKNIDEARFSEMILYGKEATKISREFGKEVRKIPDERWGQVNSYHISVLEKLFEV